MFWKRIFKWNSETNFAYVEVEMKIDGNSLQMIQNLVGDISESNLKYVDCYISDELGLFIPSVGFCEYAIIPQHTHPAYSFVLFFSKEQNIVVSIFCGLKCAVDKYIPTGAF